MYQLVSSWLEQHSFHSDVQELSTLESLKKCPPVFATVVLIYPENINLV